MSYTVLKSREHFLVTSKGLEKKLLELHLRPGNENEFFGYGFQNDSYYHYHFQTPGIEKMSDSYESNCGVFCCLKRSGSALEVFTDPLGQYPVFYFQKGNEFVVSNNFWLTAYLSTTEFNDQCAFDYVTYLSPLGNDTLSRGIKRLRAFESIQIDHSLRIQTRPGPFLRKGNYRQLLKEAGERLRNRARATLAAGVPLLHLSGGSDSRLAFAGLLVENYRGPVFSFGDGKSQDRLIFEALVEKFGLKKGYLKWFSPGQQAGHHFMNAVHSFQAFKSNSFSNWGRGCDNEYMEVTGYFGEGLLKGYGDFWGRNGRLTIFDFARKISTFSDEVFEHALTRVQHELDTYLERTGENRRIANALFYINNRSAAHFGIHTVVSNARFRSIDLLYDPLLLQLLYNCPHSDEQIKAGSLIIDLIRTIHSEALAHFPYENRVIPVFDRKSQKAHQEEPFSCFHPALFDAKELPPLKPEIINKPDETLNVLRKYPLTYFSQKELYKNELFDSLFSALSELKIARYFNGAHYDRPAEHIALSTLAVGHWMLAPDRLAALIKADLGDQQHVNSLT